MMQAREACLLRGPMGRLDPPAPERVIRDSTHIQTRARGTNYKKMENLKTPICLCVCGYHLLALQHKCMLLENTEPFITVITCYDIENATPLVLTINSDDTNIDDPEYSSDSEYSDSEYSSDSSFIGIEIGYISSDELAELDSVLSQDSDDLERVEVVYLDVPDPTLEWDDVLYYEYDPATEFSDIVSMNEEINIMDISLDKLQEFSDIVSMDHEINIMDTTIHKLDVPDPTLRGDDLLYYEYDPATEFSDIVSMNDENIMDISLDKLQDCHRIRCLRAACSDSTH